MIFSVNICVLFALGLSVWSARAVTVQVEVSGVEPADEVMLTLTPEEKDHPRSTGRKFTVPGGRGEVDIPNGIAYEIHIVCPGYGDQTLHSIMFDENHHRIAGLLIKNLTLESDAFDIVDPAVKWAGQIDLIYQYSSANGGLGDGSMFGFDCKTRGPDNNPGFRRLGRPHIVFGLRFGERHPSGSLNDIDSHTFSIGLGSERMADRLKLGNWLLGLTYSARLVYTHHNSDGFRPEEGSPSSKSDSIYGIGLNAGLVFVHSELPAVGFEAGAEWIKYGDEADLGSQKMDEEWNAQLRFQLKTFF